MDQSSQLAAPVLPLPGEGESAASALDTAKRQQTLRSRVFWFLVGAVVNYLFIATPFKYLKTHTGLSVNAIAGCSVGLSAIFFFAWNYFVNFRSESRRRDALARYVIAVFVMWALSSTTLALLKHFDFKFAFSLAGRFPLDLDIVATQLFIGGFKFLVYHRWVFPTASAKKVKPIPSAAYR